MTHKDIFKGVTYQSLERQVNGKHYSTFKTQPAEFINENKILSNRGKCQKFKILQLSDLRTK